NALRHLCLVKVTTDDGIVGWGESITQFPEASLATKAIVDGMAERVVGKDPLDTDAIWRSLHDQAWWYGYNGGIASYAISAIAIRRVKAFEEYDLTWIEEPLGAWDPSGYADLRRQSTTLIAYGEKEWNLDGYERILQTGTVDVVGVDPGRAEGITGFKKVAERVEYYRRQANAHAWSSAIATAASLAISFSSPACKLFELKPLRNPMQHDLV